MGTAPRSDRFRLKGLPHHAAAALLLAGLVACSSGSPRTDPHAHDPIPTSTACPAPVADPVLVAHNGVFTVRCLGVPAGVPLTLRVDNQDVEPHNVSLFDQDPLVAAAKTIFRSPAFTGPNDAAYPIAALARGTYHFRCDVHKETMYGILVAS